MPLEDYFIDYGKQDRRLRRIRLEGRAAALAARSRLSLPEGVEALRRGYSPPLMGAFRIACDGAARQCGAHRLWRHGRDAQTRVGAAEAALIGADLDDPATWQAAPRRRLPRIYTPMDDHRASAAYRARVAQNLLIKALHEIAGEGSAQTRIIDNRAAGGAGGGVRGGPADVPVCRYRDGCLSRPLHCRAVSARDAGRINRRHHCDGPGQDAKFRRGVRKEFRHLRLIGRRRRGPHLETPYRIRRGFPARPDDRRCAGKGATSASFQAPPSSRL